MKKLILFLILFSFATQAQITRNPETAIRDVQADLTSQNLTYASFNGVDNYVSVPNNDNLNFGTGDFSISVVFETPEVVNPIDCHIINKSIPNSTQGYEIALYNGILYATIRSASSAVFGQFALYPKTRYNVSAVFARNGNIDLYSNGALVNSVSLTSFTNNITNTVPLKIGAFQSSRFAKVKIFNLRLFNYALSASQVTALYNNGQPWLAKLPYADRGGSNVNKVTNGDFSAWTGTLPNEVPTGWVAGGVSKGVNNYVSNSSNTCRFVAQNGADFYIQQPNLLTIGKAYYYSINITNVTFGAVGIWNGASFYASFNSTGMKSGYFVATSTYFLLTNSGNTDIAFDDVKLIPLGCVADYRFNEGNGYQVKDYSGNNLHGTVFGTNYPTGAGYSTFWQNSPQTFTQWFEFGDEQISSSSATTTFTRIPPKVKLTDITVTTDTAFDASTTLSIGYSGSDGALVNALDVTTAGSKSITFTSANVQTITNERQLYIKKNQATTTGRIRIYVKYEYEGVN